MKKLYLLTIMLIQQFNFILCAQQSHMEELSSVNCIPVSFDSTFNIQLSSSGTWPNQLSCMAPPSTFGDGVVFVLTAQCTNNYIFEVTYSISLSDYHVGWRNSTTNCLPDSFTCLNPIDIFNNGNQIKKTFEIQAPQNVVYDIFIVREYFAGSPVFESIQCEFKTPTIGVSVHNITPDSISFSWSGIFDEVIVEYGPNEFNPGSDTISGPLGTIISGISSPFSLIGLNNDSTYNIYFRSRCGNNFGINTSVIRIRIPQPDSLLGLINGCSNSTFSSTIYGNYQYFPGSWILTNCITSCRMSSPELLKKFTPDSSGYHILSKTSYTGTGSTQYTFYYKEKSLGIDEKNWQCIGPSGGNLPYSQSFGPLSANTTYYILIKNAQTFDNLCTSLGGVYGNISFKVDCPGTCPIISNLSYLINSITSNSLTLLMRQGTTFGYFLIEYGLTGFTPGTDSLPGGGTIIPVSSLNSSIPISGLQPGITYDFYLRQYCSNMGLFSANSTVISATTLPLCSVSPSSVTSNRPGDSVCFGQNIKLTQNGGLLSQGAYFVWYKDSCDGTQIGMGDYIFVVPDSSRYYFVKTVDTCTVFTCVPIFVTVNSLPQVSLLNPPLLEICLGDTVVLSATGNIGWIYDWRRNGISLNTLNQPTYSTAISGLYSVFVTDTNLCSNTSQNSKVQIICFPPQDPIERYSFLGEERKKMFVISPNPNNGIFSCVFSNQRNEFQFSIFNSYGKKIEPFIVEGKLGHASFDMSRYSAGIYYLVAESIQGIFTQKIVLLSK